MSKTSPVEEGIIAHCSPIQITSYAFEKSNYISKRVCELAERSFEVGFYMIDNLPDSQENGTVIRDVYIGQEQTVKSVHCDITPLGKSRSFKDIVSKMKKRIVGWGHSHANLNTFYSSEDDGTISGLVKQWGIRKRFLVGYDISGDSGHYDKENQEGRRKGINVNVRGENITLELRKDCSSLLQGLFNLFLNHASPEDVRVMRYNHIEIPFFYGMTFNAHNDEPHCVIAYIFNEQPFKIERGIEYKVVDPEEAKPVDKKTIDNELVSRVVELKEKYAHFEEELDDAFESVKKSYMEAVESISELKNPDLKRGGENRVLLKLHDSLETCFSTADKYDPEKGRAAFVPNEEKLRDYTAKIGGFLKEMMEKLAENKPALEKRIATLKEQCDDREDRSFNQDYIKKIIGIYQEIIRKIEDCADMQKEAAKNDGQRQQK
jgi:hypothetical protein